MNKLDISAINTNSPYSIWNEGDYYYFRSRYGVMYKVGFMEDFTIWEENAYQFLILNEENGVMYKVGFMEDLPFGKKMHTNFLF